MRRIRNWSVCIRRDAGIRGGDDFEAIVNLLMVARTRTNRLVREIRNYVRSYASVQDVKVLKVIGNL